MDLQPADSAGRAAVRSRLELVPSGTQRRSAELGLECAADFVPASDGVTGYNDITPRAGVALDVFGNGKTSLKFNAGQYLQSANNQENYTISNPALDGRNGRRGPNFQTTASAQLHRLRR